MSRTHVSVIAFAVLLLSGCAAAPHTIEPAVVSKLPYVDMTCDELSTELELTQAQLALAEEKQKAARRKSVAANLVLIGGAGALVSGHVEEVARLKGTVIAITEVIDVKCVQPATEPTDDTQNAG